MRGNKISVAPIASLVELQLAGVPRFVQRAMQRNLVAIIALALAGCGYGPSFKDCAIVCSGTCPSGYSCGPEGLCYAGTTDPCDANMALDATFIDSAMIDAAPIDVALVDAALIDGGLVDGALTDAGIRGGDAPDGAVVDGPVAQDAPSGSCATPTAGVLATWNFSAETGSQTSTAPSSLAVGIIADPVSRASVLVPAAGAGSINSANWPSSSTLDPTAYYTFTITPPSGCGMDLTSLAIDAKASASGPNTAKVATSADSFAQTAGVAVTTTSTPALSVTGAGGMIEVRIYGFGAVSTTGSLRIQNTLTISGSLH